MSTDPNVDPHEETSAEPAAPSKVPGKEPIGNYELIAVIGEGGMGVVWRAHDPKLDRDVAIKVLKHTDAPVSLRQRLQREARAMARLKHPNVLTVYDAGTAGGRDFIAMELVDGCSLDAWLARDPANGDVITALLAAGRGLAAAHRAGLVHRDFKPHNILRSDDGRILVTDFGLARGLGDDSVDEVAGIGGGLDETVELATKSKTDSVLDSPLTQTGALIGTPAYMAPEQFTGAAPDPRTDQFAFCVTAWQMLTGARPHHGASLDELRKAASEGAAHVQTTLLAPEVRSALVRGLDPDRGRRWPDMDQLLAALERATRPRRPAWILPAAIVAGVGLVLGVVVLARRNAEVPERTCQAADVAFGDAWSPAARSALWQQVEPRGVSEAAFARVADTFDAWRSAWMSSYDEACRAAPSKLPRAKLGCLTSARDHAGAISLVLTKGTPQMFEAFDAHGILPNISVCDGPSPVSPPQIPVATRPRVLDVMARSFALRMQDDVAASAAALIAEAKTIDWPPLVPMIMLAQGNELLRRGDIAAARAVYEGGAKLAKSDARLVASLRLGVLEAAIGELANPDTPLRAGELPGEIGALVAAARASAKAAGNDPILMASAVLLEGEALAARARWTYDKQLYGDALAALTEAHRLFTSIGDVRRAAHVAAKQADVYLQRADEHALDDAMFVARTAEEALERAKLPPIQPLDLVQARIAFARGEYATARTRYAKLARPTPPSTDRVVKGSVLDRDGAPVHMATVIAWVGVLDGDPVNLVTDIRTGEGASAQTEIDGSFEIHAPEGAAIIAQRGPLRSSPQAATAEQTLVVAPTTAQGGRVDGRDLHGVFAFAQLQAARGTWRIRTPVHKDSLFTISGIPATGTPTLGALATTDDGIRVVTGAPLRWRHGRPLEVTVRGDAARGAQVLVVPGRLATQLKTVADVEARPAHALAWAHPIGATVTPGGRELYRRGDHHAVVAGNPPGWTTACATVDDKPLTCTEIELTDGDANDLPDGRWGAEPEAVLIELP